LVCDIIDLRRADHGRQDSKLPGYSGATYKPETEYRSDTEFGQIASRMKYVDVLAVVDELMEALEVLNPRLYDGVIRNLEDRA
jgi:hypothetical protein